MPIRRHYSIDSLRPMKRICLFPILVFFCLTACNDLNSIVVLPGTVYAPVEGGEYELSVVTNNHWETSCNVKWLKLSQTSGYGDATIHLTVKPNTTYGLSEYDYIALDASSLFDNDFIFDKGAYQ